jgi:hypothetical protein
LIASHETEVATKNRSQFLTKLEPQPERFFSSDAQAKETLIEGVVVTDGRRYGLFSLWTGATLGELGPSFGLPGVDSVSNLVRRAVKRSRE